MGSAGRCNFGLRELFAILWLAEVPVIPSQATSDVASAQIGTSGSEPKTDNASPQKKHRRLLRVASSGGRVGPALPPFVMVEAGTPEALRTAQGDHLLARYVIVASQNTKRPSYEQINPVAGTRRAYLYWGRQAKHAAWWFGLWRHYQRRRGTHAINTNTTLLPLTDHWMVGPGLACFLGILIIHTLAADEAFPINGP